MNARKSNGAEPGPETDSESLDQFVGDYLNGYREYISSKDMDEIHTPQFFKGYPFAVDIYGMPNGAVCALFRKSNRSKFTALDGDFDQMLSLLKEPDFDFMQVFPPFTSFTPDEAKRLARMDADRDLKSSRRLEMLTAAESHISEIHKDVQSMVDLNPWLDQQSAEQKQKLDRARELILELYNEVDISREERFADYRRQLSEVMAFDKGEMEEVASEIAVQLETALEEIDARINELQEVMATESDLRALGKKLDALESGGSTKELASAISKLQQDFKDISRDFNSIDTYFKERESELSEMMETVHRDSKRTYNLNERVTDLERFTANMKKESGKDTMAAVRALEGRMNVMEKEQKDLSRKLSQSASSRPKPVAVTEEPVVEVTETMPDGTTVRKTTKKTTTKRTTRSK